MRKCMVAVITAACLLSALLSGCERVQQEESRPPIEARESEYLVAVVPDLSGSFRRMMAEGDGKAYRFMMAVIDRYFRDRLGSNDRLLIAQISATQNTLLWDGQPKQISSHFQSAAAFNEFLLQNSHPAGSRCHQGLADTLEYVLSCPGVAEGRTRSAIFLLSDMEDNAPDSAEQKARAKRLLAEFAKVGGVVGMYWVGSPLTEWRQILKEAGVKNSMIESSIVAEPDLPKFD
ncbi:MAG: hypothetical protein ACK4RK_19075 [Gemmataceae bacterium]